MVLSVVTTLLLVVMFVVIVSQYHYYGVMGWCLVKTACLMPRRGDRLTTFYRLLYSEVDRRTGIQHIGTPPCRGDPPCLFLVNHDPTMFLHPNCFPLNHHEARIVIYELVHYHPVLRWVLNDEIVIDKRKEHRTRQLLTEQEIVKTIRSGRSVVVHVEGDISVSPHELQPFKKTYFDIANRHDLTVRPFVVTAKGGRLDPFVYRNAARLQVHWLEPRKISTPVVDAMAVCHTEMSAAVQSS